MVRPREIHGPERAPSALRAVEPLSGYELFLAERFNHAHPHFADGLCDCSCEECHLPLTNACVCKRCRCENESDHSGQYDVYTPQ